MKSNKSKKFLREIAFLAVLNFFPVQKLIFDHFWNHKKWNLGKKNFLKLIYLISQAFLAWTFLNFLAYCALRSSFLIQKFGSSMCDFQDWQTNLQFSWSWWFKQPKIFWLIWKNPGLSIMELTWVESDSFIFFGSGSIFEECGYQHEKVNMKI